VAMFRQADMPIVQFHCPEHGPMSVLAEPASSVADNTRYSALVPCKGHVLKVEVDARVPDATDVMVCDVTGVAEEAERWLSWREVALGSLLWHPSRGARWRKGPPPAL
jgi:hypothetical protein